MNVGSYTFIVIQRQSEWLFIIITMRNKMLHCLLAASGGMLSVAGHVYCAFSPPRHFLVGFGGEGHSLADSQAGRQPTPKHNPRTPIALEP